MTEEFDDFEERLRAALRAEADDIPVSHDALERIRARTERKRLFPWLGLVWFRPVVAVGAAALIAGSVLLGTPQIRDHVLPESFVSAADSQRAEESAPSPVEDPVGEDDGADAPAGGVPPVPEAVPPSPEPSVSDSSPSSEESAPDSCASAAPEATDEEASPSEDEDRSAAQPCPSDAESEEPTPDRPSSSPEEEDGSGDATASSSPSPEEEAPSSSPRRDDSP
ncbi:hypothetical protein NI17_001325 [Thermobifida halotolerans]|uniref:Uncharacterized protein n=1 Tax=Thermobifida halotolerans TaxID=483545 RepID=A0A399G2M1_9ACTN|nr:hypothetical protein [Thermobifida halotolerans]UOE19934.1 hypothetical protein NI17_001325 [Thermobifida halotolerans]